MRCRAGRASGRLWIANGESASGTPVDAGLRPHPRSRASVRSRGRRSVTRRGGRLRRRGPETPDGARPDVEVRLAPRGDEACDERSGWLRSGSAALKGVVVHCGRGCLNGLCPERPAPSPKPAAARPRIRVDALAAVAAAIARATGLVSPRTWATGPLPRQGRRRTDGRPRRVVLGSGRLFVWSRGGPRPARRRCRTWIDWVPPSRRGRRYVTCVHGGHADRQYRCGDCVRCGVAARGLAGFGVRVVDRGSLAPGGAASAGRPESVGALA